MNKNIEKKEACIFYCRLNKLPNPKSIDTMTVRVLSIPNPTSCACDRVHTYNMKPKVLLYILYPVILNMLDSHTIS